MFKTLSSRVIATYLLVVIISITLASLVFLPFLAHDRRNAERDDLKRQVAAIASYMGRVVPLFGILGPPGVSPDRLHQLIQGILDTESGVIGAKLFVVDSDGALVAEARRAPFLLNGFVLPRELIERSVPGVQERSFTRAGRDYFLVSTPATIDTGTTDFLMAVKPVGEIGLVASSLIWYMVLAGIIAFAVSMLIALYLSRAISRPVKAVAAAARKMAAGDYDQKVAASGSDEISELANDFNTMAERVRTAYELQRNFVGDVSHELRTPLTSIEGFSQAMLEGVVEGEAERTRSLTIINEESKRMVRVLNDLLLLSEIDAGELRTEKKPVDVTELMERMGDLFRARASEAGVELKIEPHAGPLNVNTDQDRLEGVLTNLLDNAIKYTPAGGGVSLSAEAIPGWLRLVVADTGPGIPADQLPHLFDRFYRVEKSRSTKHGGSGLGLSICKELVGTLGGNIQVQSEEGKGTTFTVTLPR